MSNTSQAFRNALHVPLVDPASGNVINIVVPGDDYVTGWSDASGLPEAPIDGEQYVRQDADWVAISLEPQDVLDLILAVDGPGSGLNADFLDGQDSTAFAKQVDMDAVEDVNLEQNVRLNSIEAKNTLQDTAISAKLDASAYTANDVLAKLKTVDGTGSGLDADTIDGIDSSALATITYVDAALAAIDCGVF